MMKFLACLGIMLATTIAYSSPDIYIFHGTGIWKDLSGNSGDYTSVVKKTFQNDGSIKIVESIETETENMTTIKVLKKGENDTSTIFSADGALIGNGYCFRKTGMKVCHCESETDEGRVEKTKHMNLDGYHEVGSHTNSEGKKVMWSGSYQRIFPEQDS